MKKTQKSLKALKLNREIIRGLGADALANVGGAGGSGGTSNDLGCHGYQSCLGQTCVTQ
jgi:hypothetical protein